MDDIQKIEIKDPSDYTTEDVLGLLAELAEIREIAGTQVPGEDAEPDDMSEEEKVLRKTTHRRIKVDNKVAMDALKAIKEAKRESPFEGDSNSHSYTFKPDKYQQALEAHFCSNQRHNDMERKRKEFEEWKQEQKSDPFCNMSNNWLKAERKKLKLENAKLKEDLEKAIAKAKNSEAYYEHILSFIDPDGDEVSELLQAHPFEETEPVKA